MGNGFLQHPKNQVLRDKFAAKEISDRDFYRQLLFLIYRLLFLMVAESRNLLLSGEDAEKVRIYQEYYSIDRLRVLAECPLMRREGFQDAWQGLRVTFALFDEDWRGESLGLSPLNGDLFGSQSLPEINECALDNYDLMVAIRNLSLYKPTDKSQPRRVNYAALDVEELGSVYESLLDFHPQVSQSQGRYEFLLLLVAGSDRKTTGAYYTPSELVAQLVKSALEPVIEERLKGASDPEKVLLRIKVCDPACGSGHFLLAAARRIGEELAKVRSREASPNPEDLSRAIRDVIQHCIYGVEVNPLAVDLCKMALWIEGFVKGMPLNFLDHRIKCGNSLVGVLDMDVLKEGIPDEAFKAVTGDDKALAAVRKKANKQERAKELQGQLTTADRMLEDDLAAIAKAWQELDLIPENTPDNVKQKRARYEANREDVKWWKSRSACNLWTAAFFMPITEQGLQLLPTTAALVRLLQKSIDKPKSQIQNSDIIDAANQLATEKRFFHWRLEFPDVFENDGFDCILGNPPWERIKLQEKEFFASRDVDIVNAANKSEREKLIKTLKDRKPDLARAFEEAKHDAAAQSKFIRESNRFPLTGVGDVNTYAVFSETVRNIISPNGMAGIIVPTGIATDDTCKKFFGDLIQSKSLAYLYDFENREKLFADVGSQMKFSLLGMSGKPINQANFAFFATQVKHLTNPARVFQLALADMALLNPNTLTCPVFRTREDAELTKKIYQRIPVLENEKTGVNPWGISFMAMLHMAKDSGLFENSPSENTVPLYEAKMFHQFNHRWATYQSSTQTRDVNSEEISDPSFTVTPRYWINRDEVESRLASKWNKNWLIAFRGITSSTSIRTAIFSLLPKVAIGHTAPILFTLKRVDLVSCLLANFNSLVFDFVARQKVGGAHVSSFIVKQLPVIPPDRYTQTDIEYIAPRVLELTYTAWDIKPFAEDMWNGSDNQTQLRRLILQQWQANHTANRELGIAPEIPSDFSDNPDRADLPIPPFIWHEERRAQIRAELDAYYAKLYSLTRDELRYILDPADIYGADFPSETFRVLKNNEMKKYGEYRTQRLVLAAWDKLGY